MSNQLYPLAREAFGNGQINWTDPAGIFRAAILSSYAYSDLHQYLSSVTPANIIAVSAPLTSRTNVGGVMDADDPIFIEIAAGQTVHNVLMYQDSGIPGTSRLILHFDTTAGGALALATDGQDVRVRWSDSATKMFRL